MTREHALKVLDTIPTIGDQVDALEMAISALEKEGDMIDKEEVKRIKWGGDKDHVWIDGKQFVSLKRFAEARKEYYEEVVESIKRAEAIAEENAHLRALLM